MRHSKLYQHLSLLSPSEVGEFKQFLASPIFNTSDSAVERFDIFEKVVVHSSKLEVSKIDLFEAFFPGEPYIKNKIDKILSHLTALVKQYLSFKMFWEDKQSRDLHLLKAYNSKKADKYMETAFKQATSLPQEGIDTDFFRTLLDADNELVVFLSRQPREFRNYHLKDFHKNLNAFFLSKKLKFACITENLRNLMGTETDLELFEEILPWIQENEEDQPLLIRLYAEVYQLLTQPAPENEVHYRKLKKDLIENVDKLKPHEARDLFDFALNYCNFRINRGAESFLMESATLYQNQVASGIVLTDGKITPFDFKNIVSVLSRIQAFEWVEQFIDSHGPLLTNSPALDELEYNRAVLEFHKGEFNVAMKIFYALLGKFRDLFYNFDCQIWLLKCYYETQDWEMAEFRRSAMEQQVRRNPSLQVARRKTYLSYLSKYRKLILACQAIPSVRKKQLTKLVKELESPSQPRFLWLIQQTQQAIQSYASEL